MKRLLAYFLFIIICVSKHEAQVNYGSAATYGLRKINTTYAGSAVRIIRSCDNATTDIAFTSCGDLDTTAIKNFVLVPNPLNALTAISPAAYSLRRLRCGVTNCIRVRRSSDNTTSDIGFTANGDLDTATMKTFVGANSAFVTIWYDQSTAGRNATQATAADQPMIMNAGVIQKQNNKPALRFQDISDGLQTANFTAYNTAFSFNGVARVSTNLTYNAFVTKTGAAPNNNFPGSFDFYNNQVIRGNGTTATFNTASQTFNAAQSLGIWTFQGVAASITASLNGTSILAGGAAGTFADAGRPLNIGKRNDGVTGLNGWIQEVVTFSTVASATDIRYLQWTQSVYYNISGPVLGTLPAGAQSGSVTIWYDQSGNAKNATAAAVANQPRIITAGVISRRNSWPVIIFDGASDYLTAATTNNAFNTTNGGTINGIGSNNGAASWQCMAQQGRNASPWWGIWGSSAAPAKWTGGNDSGPGNLSSSVNSNSYCAVTYIQNAAAVSSVIVNGVTPGVTGNPSITHANAQLFYIGYGATGSEYWNGSISELNVFALNLNDTRRILLQSNQNAYHALSHAAANIKYTTSAVASAATYTRYVLGIGSQTTASSPQDSVCETRQSAGMGFTVSTNVATAFLKNNGDYMCAGMSCPTFSTSNTFTTAPIQLRWQNDWFIDKTDVGVAGGTVSIYFDFGDYNIGTSPGAASGYSLLNRPTTASNFTVVAGATANVVGDRVYFTVDANNIVDNSFFTIGSTYPPNSPLPVELVNFKAEACDKDVCLDWKTASELNNDYFSIERSVDAESWTEIKKVKGAGTSQRTLNYSAMDYEPLPGISYYRLKQTDFDKNFKYSKIEAVEFKNTLEVGIYPNPSSGVFNISNCKGYDKLTITDMLGRKVYTADVEKDFMLLELNTLEAGSYFITLNNSVSNKKFTSKIIIDKK